LNQILNDPIATIELANGDFSSLLPLDKVADFGKLVLDNPLIRQFFDNASNLAVKQVAVSVSEKLGGTLNRAQGKGWTIDIPYENKLIVIRIMEALSGHRTKPYYRVAISGKTALTIQGKYSNEPNLTHIDLSRDYMQQIINIIESYKFTKGK
jgi:hypothetical protein